MVDVNSSTGRFLVCGTFRWDHKQQIQFMACKRIPNKPRYDIEKDFAGREDPLLVLGALLILILILIRIRIPASLDCFRGRRVVMVELVAELELHFFDPT